jgi:hypothetical protein
VLLVTIYSARNACMGSIEAARSASCRATASAENTPAVRARGVHLRWLSGAGKFIGCESIASQSGKGIRVSRICANIRHGDSHLPIAAEIHPLKAIRQHYQAVGIRKR